MPGKPIIDQQLRLYMSEHIFHNQLIPTARIGFGERAQTPV